MSRQDQQSGGVTTAIDEDIERLARERAEIEQSLEKRNSELEKLGEFAEAKCVDFKQSDRYVRFYFQPPSGSTKQWEFRKRKSKSIEEFMRKHDADSVTEMIGATHTCVRTDRGWHLRDRQSDHAALFYQHKSENGKLCLLHWPSLLLAVTSLFFALFIPATILSSGILKFLLSLSLSVLSVAYCAHRSTIYRGWC